MSASVEQGDMGAGISAEKVGGGVYYSAWGEIDPWAKNILDRHQVWLFISNKGEISIEWCKTMQECKSDMPGTGQ